MNLNSKTDRISWLLHEGDDTALLPVSERMVISDTHWDATLERQDTGMGLRVFLTSARVRESLTLEAHHLEEKPWVAGNVAVKGRVRIELSDGPSADISPTTSIIFRPSDRRARFTPRPTRDLRLAGFMIAAERLELMFGAEMPPLFRTAIAAGDGSPLHALPCSTHIRRLAATLFTRDLRGAMRLIFMEAVVLQILIEQTAGMLPAKPGGRKAPSPDRRTIDRARQRLFADLRNPPDLAALATEVGLSEKALNAGFRATYGTTVFETLRDKRLDDARILLETESLSLKTIAFRVGYSHLSNFSRAFALKFGVPPRRYVKFRD